MARVEVAPDGDSRREPARRDVDQASEHDAVALPAGPFGGLTQVVLPADMKAPFAARTLLRLCYGPLLDARVLSDARLVLSELVTACLRHGALGDGDGDGIVVRVRLGAESVLLEVHHRGIAGDVALNGSDAVRGRSLGLDIVRLLSVRWGVRRGEDTCVWVEMARA